MSTAHSQAKPKAKTSSATRHPGASSTCTSSQSPVPTASARLGAFYAAGPVWGLGAPVQAKLHISQPGDPHEHEAERVADTVMRMPAPAVSGNHAAPMPLTPLAPHITPMVQQASNLDEADMEMQPTLQQEPVQEAEPETQDIVATQPRIQRMAETEPQERDEEIVAARLASGTSGRLQGQDDEEGGLDQENHTPVQAVNPYIQRLCTECAEEMQRPAEEEEAAVHTTPLVHRQTVARASPMPPQGVRAQPPSRPSAVAANIQALRGGGSLLAPSIRAFFEPRFGTDLSQVRIHTDARAAETARSIQAQAFTVGNDIVFGAGHYAPATERGQHLLAHELAHTIQQSGGQASRQISRRETPESESEATAESTDVTEATPATAETATPATGDEEEIHIPSFDTGGDSGCYQLVTQEPLIPGSTGGGTEGGRGTEAAGGEGGAARGREGEPGTPPAPEAGNEPGVARGGEAAGSGPFAELLRMAMPSVPGGGVLNLLPGLGGGALQIWQRLPLTIRAAAITRAIGLAISGVAFVPPMTFGLLGGWFRAGLIGFLRRIQSLGDREKVFLFEKYLSIAFGQNLAYMWGYIKGLFEGFFVDGLLGIIQMVIDIICLIGKIPQFITSLIRFFGAFPEHMQNLAVAIYRLSSAMDVAAANAVSEVQAMLRDPQRIVGLLENLGAATEAVGSRMGEMIADGMIRFMRLPAERMGKTIGRLSGMVLFEVLLAVATYGGGAAVTAGKVVVRAAVKLVAFIGRQLLAIGRFIMSTMRLIMPFVRQAGRYLTRFFRAVADRLLDALRAVDDFFAEILRRCRPTGSWTCRVPRAVRRRPEAGVQISGVTVRGFRNAGEVIERVGNLRNRLARLGVGDARIGIRGSSITGVSSKGGGWRHLAGELKASDVDFFFTSPSLEARIARLDPSAFVGGRVRPETLRRLVPDIADELDAFARQTTRQIGRKADVTLLRRGLAESLEEGTSVIFGH